VHQQRIATRSKKSNEAKAKALYVALFIARMVPLIKAIHGARSRLGAPRG